MDRYSINAEHNEMTSLVPVTFRFPRMLVPQACRVTVIGAFNGWRGDSHRLRMHAEGDWMITIFLPPGRVVYAFDVDGTRWCDPQHEDHGSLGTTSRYSVRHVSLETGTEGGRAGQIAGR